MLEYELDLVLNHSAVSQPPSRADTMDYGDGHGHYSALSTNDISGRPPSYEHACGPLPTYDSLGSPRP